MNASPVTWATRRLHEKPIQVFGEQQDILIRHAFTGTLCPDVAAV